MWHFACIFRNDSVHKSPWVGGVSLLEAQSLVSFELSRWGSVF